MKEFLTRLRQIFGPRFDSPSTARCTSLHARYARVIVFFAPEETANVVRLTPLAADAQSGVSPAPDRSAPVCV